MMSGAVLPTVVFRVGYLFAGEHRRSDMGEVAKEVAEEFSFDLAQLKARRTTTTHPSLLLGLRGVAGAAAGLLRGAALQPHGQLRLRRAARRAQGPLEQRRVTLRRHEG